MNAHYAPLVQSRTQKHKHGGDEATMSNDSLERLNSDLNKSNEEGEFWNTGYDIKAQVLQ